ncbi:hypothetical protein NHQ30_011356 [Ciborinia camelliae]|nr:hypothetical protein NHQ30_011356 [Ciborinia camelliae]
MPLKESGKRAKWWKKLCGDRSKATSPAPSPTQSIAPVKVQSPKQGDVQRDTKAFSNATEQHAPSKPSAADVRTTGAGTDAGGKQPPQPATAFTLKNTPKSPPSDNTQTHVVPSIEPQAKELQPTTDPIQQQSTALSTSQRLWNAAYDRLEEDKDTAKLVRSYVETLTEVLKANTPKIVASGADDISAELKDPAKRQKYLGDLVKEGQSKVAIPSKITKGVGDIAQFVLSAKGMIDAAIQNIPQAALPWAGVCIGLQILLNPAKASKSNLAGITHVVSRMDWYCALTEHLDKCNIKVGDESFESILQMLEEEVIILYKALLQYQMKSICSYYYRNQVFVFLRGLANLDDWDGDLKSVTDAEETLQKDLDLKHAQGREELLGDIRQDIRHFISQQKDIRRDDMETACRKDLRVVDPQHDMERIEKSKDTLLEDAYKWILGTKEYAAFTNWDDSRPDFSSSRLLWIKGHAGTGKTMLMIGIIRELSYRVQDPERPICVSYSWHQKMSSPHNFKDKQTRISLLLWPETSSIWSRNNRTKELWPSARSARNDRHLEVNGFETFEAYYRKSKAHENIIEIKKKRVQKTRPHGGRDECEFDEMIVDARGGGGGDDAQSMGKLPYAMALASKRDSSSMKTIANVRVRAGRLTRRRCGPFIKTFRLQKLTLA